MRLAVFNVQNLFDRAKAMNQESWADGRPILREFAKLNELLGLEIYTVAGKRRMVALMKQLGLEKRDEGPFVILRRNRGGLVRRPQAGGIEIIANGRADWAGSLELKEEPIDVEAMRNTARVMRDVDADVLGIVEAENRPNLIQFNEEIVAAVNGVPYRHAMLIDGNDDRGIDVGILTRKQFPIYVMRSHVDDENSKGERIFSRDCPEFTVETPSGEPLVVLVNHLKSKGYGSQADNDRRRKAQATQIKKIYQRLVNENVAHVAVIGDFNDSPDSDPLKPLLKSTNLRDVAEHKNFDDGGFPGTFKPCNQIKHKIDYILLSPKLYQKIQRGGVWRMGVWPGVRPKKWQCYPEVKKEMDAASDHAAVWVDLEL
jgi:endonuclease/exonuclease/phosphatase family metal-dependent hydrolase